jgi:hypothetical protein
VQRKSKKVARDRTRVADFVSTPSSIGADAPPIVRNVAVDHGRIGRSRWSFAVTGGWW